MDSRPSSTLKSATDKPGILLEGSLGFENEGFVSSFSNYWTQIVRSVDKKTKVTRIVFRVTRDKKSTLKGASGDLLDNQIKRQVILWSSLGDADTQLPRKVLVNVEQDKSKKFMSKGNFDFTIQVDSSAKYKLRASSEQERQQWVDLLRESS